MDEHDCVCTEVFHAHCFNIVLCCMASPSASTYPDVYCATREEWRLWLVQNHAISRGVWLVYFKKESGKVRVEYDSAVEEALCYGWIDSVVRAIDQDSYKQLFTPRKPTSNWSKLNKERAERLIANDTMTPAGLRLIDLAKTSGTWSALDEVENLIIPNDMQKLFDQYPNALVHWNAFSRSVRRGILEYILNAKRPETRLKRITEAVRCADQNIRYIFDTR
jgi:uncharacterized protein YdeI (YjbR/CyaY-like superfamily)